MEVNIIIFIIIRMIYFFLETLKEEYVSTFGSRKKQLRTESKLIARLDSIVWYAYDFLSTRAGM